MIHKFILLLFILNCNTNSISNISIDRNIECFTAKWNKKLTILLKNDQNSLPILKNIASKLGLNINFEINDICINYQAKNKSFLDILIDISEILNLKILINDINASFYKDSIYIKNYSFSSLLSSKKTKISTAVDHNFNEKESQENSSKSSYISEIDSYEEIKKNLDILMLNENEQNRFFINKEAGLITVIASQKVQKKISKYLNSLKKTINNETLISAKIIEIKLNDDLEYGVNWNKIIEKLKEIISVKEIVSSIVCVDTSSFMNSEHSFFKLISEYGTSESISNPRIIIANNHIGIFKAIENKIYFEFQSNSMVSLEKNKIRNTVTKADIKTAVVGVIFSVQAVKLSNGKIKLYIKTTISEVSEEIDNMGEKVLDKQEKNVRWSKIPIIKTREIESVLTVNDKSSLIIGGLIYSKMRKISSGPFSFLSRLFKKNIYNKKCNEKVEMVIVLNVESLQGSYDDLNFYDYLINN